MSSSGKLSGWVVVASETVISLGLRASSRYLEARLGLSLWSAVYLSGWGEGQYRREENSVCTRRDASERHGPIGAFDAQDKGREARLAFMGLTLMENGNGLLTDFVVSRATGTAERDAVPVMLGDARQLGFHSKTLGGT